MMLPECFFFRSHMVQYLTLHHAAPLNQLLQAVLKDIQCPYLIAGCKALGIIDKIVFGDVFKVLLFPFIQRQIHKHEAEV